MADNNSTLKPRIPSLGSTSKPLGGGIPKLPQLHAPNSMGLKPLSVPGASRPASTLKPLGSSPLLPPVGLPKPPVPAVPAAPPSVPSNPEPASASPDASDFSMVPDPNLNETMALDPDQIPSSLPETSSSVADDFMNGLSAETESPSPNVSDEPSLLSDDAINASFAGSSAEEAPDAEAEAAAEAVSSKPEIPVVPAAPSIPVVPSAPGIPSVAPSAPGIPVAPSAPSIPPMPGIAAAATAVAEASKPAAADLNANESSIDPNANDDELLWEDEEEGGEGEKTQMLDMVGFDEDEEEADGEKTQIQMEAFEFEPLEGKLVVLAGTTDQPEYNIVREHTGIGRSNKNEIVIADNSISRQHITIEKERGGFRIMDPGSSNGTFLNGDRILKSQLRNGDIIEIGNLRFRFEQSGGDPAELWTGERIIDLHPNQAKPKTGAAAHPINYPNKNSGSSPSPAPAPASDARFNLRKTEPAPIPAPAPAPAPAPTQSETMLERAGGGLAAPQWAPPPISPLTSPYMMSYGGNMQPNRETPGWAYAMICIAAAVCLGSFIFLVISWAGYNSRKEEVKKQESDIELLTKNIENGVIFYAEKHLEDARNSFRDAEKVSIPEFNTGELIEKYMTLLDEEDELNKKMMAANREYRQKKTDELAQDIDAFSKVSVDSVFYSDISSLLMPKLKSEYMEHLVKDARAYAKDGNIDKAREVVAKISTLENSARKVRELNNYIEAQQKRNN